MTAPEPRYRKVLLKISGEVLMGDSLFGIDTVTLDRVAADIKEVVNAGFDLCLVVGGGNIIRGARLAEAGTIDLARYSDNAKEFVAKWRQAYTESLKLCE